MKLILLPGLDGTGELFAPLLGALDANIEVQVLRYPADACLGYDELTEQVRNALPRNESYAVLGESFSGPIALRLSAEQPPGLRALLLCCTFASNPRPGAHWLQSLLPMIPFSRLPSGPMLRLLLGSGAPPDTRAKVEEVVRRLPSNLIAARLTAVMKVDVRPAARELKLPTLYLQAVRDRLVPAHCGQWIKRHSKATSLVRLAGPHGLLQATANRRGQAHQGFLQRLTATNPSTDP